MANGDITKEYENDKVEVVSRWNIQVRKATKIMEEQSDGSKKELTRSFHRHVLQPFLSVKGSEFLFIEKELGWILLLISIKSFVYIKALSIILINSFITAVY